MQNTTNLNLNKPEESEKIDLELLNQNMDIIDQSIKDISDNFDNVETEIESLTHNIANISESIDTLDLNTLKKNDIETDTYIQELVRDIPGNSDNPLSELEIQTMIDTSFTENLSDVKIAQDAEGKWGYIPPGADAVIPFKSDNDGNSEKIIFHIKTTTDFVKITPEVQEGW